MNKMTLVAARLFAYDNLFLETGESIPTLPQERFLKAFLKLFEPQRDSATSKSISCFTLFKTYTMALLARLLLSN